MSQLLKNVDARTKLAGTNKLEILLFTLGLDPETQRKETYGINVFKVREVLRVPEITRAPEMPAAVEGMVSLRGSLVPVVDLAKYVGTQRSPDFKPEIMIVTEYNGQTQGFLVEEVDTILRLDWSSMRVPPVMLTAQTGGLVTAVTEIDHGKLIMMMDVEKVLAETCSKPDDDYLFRSIKPISVRKTVYFADDSSVARKQIERTLQALDINYHYAMNGKLAWDELDRMANYAEMSNSRLCDSIQLILTDIEMPEMDGYMLTKKIKGDQRFARIPVLMHSSLSGMQNQHLGLSVGVDEYVPKFEPQRLAQVLIKTLLKEENSEHAPQQRK